MGSSGAVIGLTPAQAAATYVPLTDLGALTTGEETVYRPLCQVGTIVSGSTVLRFTYFTARKTETTTQVRMCTGGTAAAATPTLCRVGLYLIDGAGDGTLVASIANDTTLWAAANTAYTRAWTTPYNKVAGQRYAYGTLVVTGVAAPTFLGNAPMPGNPAETAQAPRMGGSLAAQPDLPASFTNASLSATGQQFYAVILP